MSRSLPTAIGIGPREAISNLLDRCASGLKPPKVNALVSYVNLLAACEYEDLSVLIKAAKQRLDQSATKALRQSYLQLINERQARVGNTLLSPWASPQLPANQLCFELFKILYPESHVLDYIRLLEPEAVQLLDVECHGTPNAKSLDDMTYRPTSISLSEVDSASLPSSEIHDYIVVGKTVVCVPQLFELFDDDNRPLLDIAIRLMTTFWQDVRENHKDIYAALLANREIEKFNADLDILAGKYTRLREALARLQKALFLGGVKGFGNNDRASNASFDGVVAFKLFFELFSEEDQKSLEQALKTQNGIMLKDIRVRLEASSTTQCSDLASREIRSLLDNSANQALLDVVPGTGQATREQIGRELVTQCGTTSSIRWRADRGALPTLYLDNTCKTFVIQPARRADVEALIDCFGAFNDAEIYAALLKIPAALEVFKKGDNLLELLVHLENSQVGHLMNCFPDEFVRAIFHREFYKKLLDQSPDFFEKLLDRYLLIEGKGSELLTWLSGFLFDFIEIGSINGIKKLIAAGVDKEKENSDGWTPLHVAAENGRPGCIQALLDAGADIDKEGPDGLTPLHVAVKADRLDCVQALLDAGAGKDRKDRAGRTPLHVAAVNGRPGCIQALLNAGADINKESSHGWTPLHLAASCGYLDCLQALLDADADKEKENSDGRTPLHLAASWGELDCLQALLDAGAGKDRKNRAGWTPLHWAASSGYLGCVQALLDADAGKDRKDRIGRTPLHSAASWGYLDCLQALLDAGADIDKKDCEGLTPLHVAASWGHPGCIQALLNAGADIDKESFVGQTPLHEAVKADRLDCVQALLDAGAEKYRKDIDGNTPWDLAIAEKHPAIIQVFRSSKALDDENSKVRDDEKSKLLETIQCRIKSLQSFSSKFNTSNRDAKLYVLRACQTALEGNGTFALSNLYRYMHEQSLNKDKDLIEIRLAAERLTAEIPQQILSPQNSSG